MTLYTYFSFTPLLIFRKGNFAMKEKYFDILDLFSYLFSYYIKLFEKKNLKIKFEKGKLEKGK